MKIIIVWIFLLVYGIAAIFSVSIYESFSVTLQNGLEPSNYFYLYKQLYNIFIASVSAVIVYFIIPLKWFKNHKFVLLVSVWVFLLQLWVFLPWLWATYHGARWWIDIPWLPSIQPAEFFKLWYVIFLSSWLIRKQKFIDTIQFYVSFAIVNAILFIVFLLIPDLWSVLVMGLTWMVMAWYSWARFKHLAVLFVWWLVGSLILAFTLSQLTSKFNYLEKRLGYFFESSTDDVNRGVWWQNYQALVAIWWWWFRWQWYGKWLQKFGYIPEAQSDFIFAAFSEEEGFVWNIILLFLYCLLIYFVIKDLTNLKDPHIKILWIWILSLIIVQVFVNIGVNIRLLPNTWLTLPFISYGGTAIMVNLIELVLLQKIVRYKKRKFLK